MAEQEGYKHINLYGISGSFEDSSFRDPKPTDVAFGGYFKENPEAGTIHGELIDFFGPSVISGELKEGEFTFIKTYVDQVGIQKSADIKYEFKKNDDTWSGNYSGSGVEGNAECQTNLISEDAYFIAGTPTDKPRQS